MEVLWENPKTLAEENEREREGRERQREREWGC